jgi:hypothetical protein
VARLPAGPVEAIVAFGPRGLPRLDDIVVDARVLAFSIVLAVVTGLVFGLVPAFHAARTELGQMLKDGMRGGSRRATQRTRGALVVTELALAVVLLVGAGLLIRSFVKLMQVDPGFQTEHIVSFDVTLPTKKYPYDRDLRRFAAQLREGLSSLPGTQSVAVAFARPLELMSMRATFEINGRPPRRTTSASSPTSARLGKLLFHDGNSTRPRSRLHRRRGEFWSAAGRRRHTSVRAKVFPK